jgi:hypothetical protein
VTPPPDPIDPEELIRMSLDAAAALGAHVTPDRAARFRADVLEHLERSADLHHRSAFMLRPAHVGHISTDELRELQARAEERRRRAAQQAALRARLTGRRP